MKSQLRKAILEWLRGQEDGYLFNNQNFLTTAGSQYLSFNGHVLVSDKVFNTFKAPWQPLNASIEIPVKLGDENFILTFNLFKVSSTPDNFLVIASNGTEAEFKYLKRQVLKNDLEKMENSSNDALLVSSRVRNEDGSYLSKQDALNEVEVLKSWLIDQSLWS
ncbi:hypothetical protein P7L54_20840 [Acinetobacter bereziniae]|uniref:Uncharacterized protein n=1 Tax=Acinetobacter bereziniae LMG 1003 = CIP 70.12 TaxID=981324 RepID=N9DJ95_ACIBZ|nr:hypothetical protein [Acinetobacter bereziniae]ENV98302.1 hypothetical protein F938_01156 [Acinetobacter bereziniae LMG 1003 = CIP 70.12]MBJ9908549.1 hypothetical protein [Acinetobacter bereziniae]MBJ9929858.1 hypothetical protein [Acinetobacter bereziniae]MDG3558389.1 hypothetical protein [Acinetobacter bereziniae]MDP6003546.1 hypothetical protein [Acinetobacter bereziniae]